MIQIFIQGGPVMILLAMCSLVGTYIAIQKLLFLRANEIKSPLFIDKVKQSITDEGVDPTVTMLKRDNRIMTDFLAECIQLAKQPFEELQFRMGYVVDQNLDKLNQNVTTLASIIHIAPILGLLGTMFGLIDLFNVISGGNIGNAEALSAGIAEALITTVTGLSIAIPFIFINQFLRHKINQFIKQSEKHANEILDYCRPAHVK